MLRRRNIALLFSITCLGVLFFRSRPAVAPIDRYPPPRLHVVKPVVENTVIPPKPADGKTPDGWRPFKPPDSYLLKPFVVEPSLTQRLPCLDLWVSQGKPCVATERGTVDAVWTWVNGSESILAATRNAVVAEAMAKLQGPRRPLFRGARSTHFREHGEMINSMRSVWKSMPSTLVNKYILLTADVSADDTEELRLGSVPIWMNTSQEGRLQVLHHSEVFRVPEASLPKADNRANKGREWRDRYVPSFNSLAIESQLANIPQLAPTVFYLNDDCFILKPLSEADFETPLYGPVFRIQFNLGVKGKSPGSSMMGVDKEGEWPGLQYTNWLLDERFGRRERRYLHHVAKVLPVPIMREAAAIWKEEISQTAESRFRGHGPQVNLLFLTTWYTIEKHRESLLYSFIMLRADANADGVFSPAERRTLINGLESGKISLSLREGGSTHWIDVNLQNAGLDTPKETEYDWLSSDGYPLIATLHKNTPEAHCIIDVAVCFPAEIATSLDVFRRVAFEKGECGDCLISHLINRSGPTGLGAFLPPPGPPSVPSEEIPTLPLERRWQDVVFRSGMGRKYAVNMIQRYNYVIGSSPMQFLELRRVKDAQRLPNVTNPVAFLAVNDDLRSPLGVAQLDMDMKTWYAQRWGGVRAWWEKEKED
ncbi:hypothetical protein C8F04DRAFT_1060505 [Mycena alexandri]|uniref:Stealth protein CR3 conserved region 3 domain-containing protein n=1 Tax=Mycena alexandri TaxID=1745969 RepID=A0AAD6TM96_9AGAR|nr:hypothetical protein C8F04DRAFT_1060505 [Mycena alexandri]